MFEAGLKGQFNFKGDLKWQAPWNIFKQDLNVLFSQYCQRKMPAILIWKYLN